MLLSDVHLPPWSKEMIQLSNKKDREKKNEMRAALSCPSFPEYKTTPFSIPLLKLPRGDHLTCRAHAGLSAQSAHVDVGGKIFHAGGCAS